MLLDGAMLSGVCQLLAFVGGVLIGRRMTNHAMILLVAAVASVTAMMANIVYDGQGAFIWLFAAPLIYMLAIVGRDEFRRDRS